MWATCSTIMWYRHWIMPGSEALWLEGVDERFSDYTLGEDGTSVMLPANSTDIVVINVACKQGQTLAKCKLSGNMTKSPPYQLHRSQAYVR